MLGAAHLLLIGVLPTDRKTVKAVAMVGCLLAVVDMVGKIRGLPKPTDEVTIVADVLPAGLALGIVVFLAQALVRFHSRKLLGECWHAHFVADFCWIVIFPSRLTNILPIKTTANSPDTSLMLSRLGSCQSS